MGLHSSHIAPCSLVLQYRFHSQTKINNEGIVVNLLELGYLHNRIVSQLKQLEKGGAVNQAIHGAVKHIVVDYYAMIGCINAEVSRDLECKKLDSRFSQIDKQLKKFWFL